MTTTLNTITATATEFGFDAGITFSTQEQLDTFIALFPKSTKVVATRLTTLDGATSPHATFGIRLVADNVNGGTNETGLKRLHKFVAVATSNGYEIHNNPCYGNSLTQEAFDKLIGRVIA